MNRGPQLLYRSRLARLVLLLLAARTLRLLVPGVQAIAVREGGTARDFVQEYLLARASLLGTDPYLPQPALAAEYLPQAVSSVLSHPVPHPPSVALLVAPLGALPYNTASLVWLASELACLGVTVLLLARASGSSHGDVATLLGLSLLWPPVLLELRYGQLNLLIGVLLAASWVALRSGRQRPAGILLGLAGAVKLYPLLVAGLLVSRRQWTALRWCLGTTAAVLALTVLSLGPDAMVSYITRGLPSTRQYLVGEGNYSLLSTVLRSTGGSNSLAPLIPLGPLSPVAALVPLTVLLSVGAWAIARARDLDLAYSLAVCLLIPIGPIAWQYYCCILILPLWVLWRKGARKPVLTALLLLSVPSGALGPAGFWLARALGWHGVAPPFPAAVGLPFLLLPAGALLLTYFVLREIRCDVAAVS